MRKAFRKWKIFLALTLSVGMVASGMPLTALAAPAEAAEESEIEQAAEIDAEDEENNEEESKKGLEKSEEETGKDSGEGDGETGKDSEKGEEEQGKDSEEGEEEQGKDIEEGVEDAGNSAEDGAEETEKDPESGEEEADQDSEDEEETEEGLEAEESEEDEAIEEEEESVESAEVMMLTSASDFVINNDGVLTSYTGTDADVAIPEGVVTIGENAFKDNATIKTVRFSSTVTTIGNSAFYNCGSLSSVELNEGLETIGNQAFAGAALGEKLSTGALEPGTLVIPSTVTSIGYGAFYKCVYLGTVIFEDGGTAVLEIDRRTAGTIGTFSSCPELTKITLPSRLTNILSFVFYNNPKLNEVILGDKVETIGESAFANCGSLKSINFPSSVKAIERAAFRDCSSLGPVELNEGLVTIGEYAFEGDALGEKLSTGAVELGTLTIPGTVQSIGYAAFHNCAYLGTVIFEDGDAAVLELYSNMYGTFSSCSELTKIILPSRLTDISSKAFMSNPKLKEVILGDKVETIGESAFANCSSLKSINFPSSVKTIGNYAFNECSSLGPVELNEGLVTIGYLAFSGTALGEKSSAGTLTIPSTVQSIGPGAFYKCAYLGKVIFANGDTVVLEIDSNVSFNNGTFSECPKLTTVILPERITKLENHTFYNNAKLDTLYISENVMEFASYAISECPKLTIYGIPGSEAQTYAKQNKIPFKSRDSLKGDFLVKSVKVTPGVIEEIGASAIGKTIRLTATVLPDTAQNRAVTYASDDETVAAVDQNGLVTITGYGETRITVTTKDGGKTASCMVVVLKEAIDERSDITEANVLFPKKKAEYSAVYTGEQIRPVMTVTYPYTDANGRAKTQTLKLNVDYTISYGNNVNVGEDTARVTIRGIGEYKGVTTKTFTITPKNIRNVTLSQVGDIVYGETPSVVVMDGTYELTKGKDYEVILTTEGSASEDTPSVLTVEGLGNYTGTSRKSAKFNILKTGTDIQPVASETISVAFKKLPANGYTYNGKAQKPAVVVTDTSTGKKVAASNYKVIYTNNINAGTAAVRVVGVSKKGKGYYGVSEALTFEIKPKDFKRVSVSTKGLIPKAGTIEDIQKSVEDALTVKDGKHILSTDEYEIDYGNIGSAGDIKVGTKYPITLTAKAGGNYVAGTQKTISIKFGQLNLASWTAKLNVRIVDAEQNEILLRYNGTLLEKGKDYTVVVKKDKNRDTYTVTVKAVKNGAYKGSKTFKKLTVN